MNYVVHVLMLALIIELHCRPTCFYRFVPFAGFFSCEAGMPLIANRQAVNDKEFRVSFTVKDKSTLKDMPKKCPEGFNAMLAHVNLGCWYTIAFIWAPYLVPSTPK